MTTPKHDEDDDVESRAVHNRGLAARGLTKATTNKQPQTLRDQVSTASDTAQTAEAGLRHARQPGLARVAGFVARGLGRALWIGWLVEVAVDAGAAIGRQLTRTEDLLEAQARSATLVFAAAGLRRRPALPEGYTKGAPDAQIEGWLAKPDHGLEKDWKGRVLVAEAEIFREEMSVKPLWETYKELVIAQHPPAATRFDGADLGWKKEWASIVRDVPLEELGL